MAHNRSRVGSNESGVRPLSPDQGAGKRHFFWGNRCYVIPRYAGQESLMSNNIYNLTCPILCPTLSIPRQKCLAALPLRKRRAGFPACSLSLNDEIQQEVFCR